MFDGILEQSTEYDGDIEDGQHPHSCKRHMHQLTSLELQVSNPIATAPVSSVTVKGGQSASKAGSAELDDDRLLARDESSTKNGK